MTVIPAYFTFNIASLCSVAGHLTLQVCALQQVEENAEQHSIGNHTVHMAQLVEQLTISSMR